MPEVEVVETPAPRRETAQGSYGSKERLPCGWCPAEFIPADNVSCGWVECPYCGGV